MQSKPDIYFIDFDGTITRADSFIKFIFFSKGVIITLGVLAIAFPIYLFFKSIKKDTGFLKERIIGFLYRDLNIDCFNKIASDFSNYILPKMIKDSFKRYILKIKKNDKVVIVSASLDNYLRPWCEKNNFDLLATELEHKNGKLTGKFHTKNCNGNEKVHRIISQYDLNNFDKIYVFGNSKGDREMLALGTNSYFKFFD